MSGRKQLALAALAVAAMTWTANAIADPTNTAAPSIAGGATNAGSGLLTADPPSVLTAGAGSWSSSSPVDYRYQWQRCSYVNAVIDAGPLGFWRLDETAGTTATDTSGWSNDANVVGTPTFGGAGALSTDADSSALFPPGAGAAAAIAGGIPADASPLTGEAWINTGSFASGAVKPIMSGASYTALGNGSWSFSLVATSANVAKLQLNVGAPIIERSAATFVPNRWYFVAFTDTGTAQRLYVNGALDSTFSATSAKVAAPTLRIGYLPTATPGAGTWFNGWLDEVALFDSALAGSDLTAQYRAASNPSSGAGCEDLLGSTSASYTVSGDDTGASLRAEVTAFGDNGVAFADSAAVQVAGTAPASPSAPVAQTEGPVFDEGTVIDTNGNPVPNALVALYPDWGGHTRARPPLLALTTTDVSGGYRILLDDAGLVAGVSRDGAVNVVREIIAGSTVSATNVVRQFDPATDSWTDETGELVAATATVLDPAQPGVVSLARAPAAGFKFPCKDQWDTLKDNTAWTVVGELHSYTDDSARWSYGRAGSSDSTIAIGVSQDNSSFTLSGSVHIGDAANVGKSASGRWAHMLLTKFEYVDQVHRFCGIPIGYQTKATHWITGLQVGADVSYYDGGCNYYPANRYTMFPPASWFDRSSKQAYTYGAAVSIFGATLSTQSGFSKNVALHYDFGSSLGAHYLCGDTGPPSSSTKVFAGP